MYYHFFIDEELPEEEALHKLNLACGISKPVLEEIVEQWECHKSIRVTATASRGQG